MDTRRQALDIAGRRQGLELGEIQRKRDAIRYLLQTVNQGYQNKKAEQAAEKAQKDAEPGFFGSGGGMAVGSLAGMGVGALAGGLQGAMLGGMIGTGTGAVADVALAPGTPGAAAGAQRVANMPNTLMAYDQYYGQEAQGRRQAETDLLKARTGAYNRANPTPPNWPVRKEINKAFDEYMEGKKKLVSEPTFVSPFGLQRQFQPGMMPAPLRPRTGWDGKPLPSHFPPGGLDF